MIGVQQILDGLTLGGVYALSALGFAIIYRFLGFMQLSQGQLVTLGAYIGLLVARIVPSFWFVLPATLVVMAALGWLAYRFLFKRVLGGSHLTPLMIALGLGLIIEETLRILVEHGNPVAYPLQLPDQTYELPGGNYVAASQLLILVVAVMLVLAADWLVRFTAIGVKMRAVAANRVAAELLGIDADAIFGGVVVVGFCSAGLLGVLLGSSFSFVSPSFGNLIGDLGLAVVLTAGLGSLLGTLVTACLIGFAESVATAIGYSNYIVMVPFVVIIAVLLFMPFGLFGALAEHRN